MAFHAGKRELAIGTAVFTAVMLALGCGGAVPTATPEKTAVPPLAVTAALVPTAVPKPTEQTSKEILPYVVNGVFSEKKFFEGYKTHTAMLGQQIILQNGQDKFSVFGDKWNDILYYGADVNSSDKPIKQQPCWEKEPVLPAGGGCTQWDYGDSKNSVRMVLTKDSLILGWKDDWKKLDVTPAVQIPRGESPTLLKKIVAGLIMPPGFSTIDGVKGVGISRPSQKIITSYFGEDVSVYKHAEDSWLREKLEFKNLETGKTIKIEPHMIIAQETKYPRGGAPPSSKAVIHYWPMVNEVTDVSYTDESLVTDGRVVFYSDYEDQAANISIFLMPNGVIHAQWSDKWQLMKHEWTGVIPGGQNGVYEAYLLGLKDK